MYYELIRIYCTVNYSICAMKLVCYSVYGCIKYMLHFEWNHRSALSENPIC